jgi:hypothetical protein
VGDSGACQICSGPQLTDTATAAPMPQRFTHAMAVLHSVMAYVWFARQNARLRNKTTAVLAAANARMYRTMLACNACPSRQSLKQKIATTWLLAFPYSSLTTSSVCGCAFANPCIRAYTMQITWPNAMSCVRPAAPSSRPIVLNLTYPRTRVVKVV